MEGGIVVHSNLELARACGPALLEQHDGPLHLAHEPRALFMLVPQLQHQRLGLRRALDQRGEEVFVLLRMVELLGKLIDVADHGAKRLESRMHARVLRHARELLQAVQHG